MTKNKKRSRNYKNKSRKSLKFKIKLTLIILAAVGFASVLFSATNTASPLSATVSNVLGTAPVVQKDNIEEPAPKGVAESKTVLVKFKPSVSAHTKSVIYKQNKGKVEHTLPKVGVQEVKIPANESIHSALKKYSSNNQVAYVEPNYIAKQFFTPNDKFYSQEWNLSKIGASKAWDISKGGYGPIAIVDTGVDAAHSDLKGEVLTGYNLINGSTGTNDDNGHGTHVAGIIAGITNNSNGIASIGFKGSILPVKVLDASGAGTYADVANGIIYAADHGAKVINLSLGGAASSDTLQSAVSYAQSKGAIVVAAAGNNGDNSPVYPADYPGVVAVSATTPSDTLASFSSYGSHTFVGAPGTNIISTYNNGGYATMSGTSMAAPEVSGLLGLALSSGNITDSTLLNDLKTTSDKVGPYPYNSNGWNQYFGYGRIDAAKLLQKVTGTTSTATTSSASKSVSVRVAFRARVLGASHNRRLLRVRIGKISRRLRHFRRHVVYIHTNRHTTLRHGRKRVPLGRIRHGRMISGILLWKNHKLIAIRLGI